MPDFCHRRLVHRTNMLGRTSEQWRPPLFVQPAGRWASVLAAFRRFLDLQAGSIWRDLKDVLPHVTGTIVDVGCGAQPYRSLVPAAARYIGIDSASGKDRFGYDVPHTRYFRGDHWPIEDASADFVLCTETLEHVRDTQKFLAEAFRCLAPGGTFLVTVPFAARWHFVPHDYWRFTPSGLAFLLEGSGFVNISIYARGNACTVACYKVMALLLKLSLPQTRTFLSRLILRLVFLPFVPVLIFVATIANCSLLGKGGEDCLGYTAISERKSQ